MAFHAGAVVVGTWDRHAAEVLELIRQLGLDSHLIFNRGAVMVLPSGITKAVGVQRALQELRRSERNLIAFGDAENDLPLLAMAEIGVAARGSVPALAATADDHLTQPGSGGVAQYIQRVLAQGGVVPTPPRQHVILGNDATGTHAVVPGSGVNVMISGDPRAGKSWLGGLLAERLIERGYRLCVIDPEGDHLPLGERPQIITLGHDLPLPAPAAVPRVLDHQPLSVVLNLASLSHSAKLTYVDAVLAALNESRAATGIPHWTLIDEAHYFFHENAHCVRRFDAPTGNHVFITYRPSLVAPQIHDAVGAYLITHTAVEEERSFVTSLLRARGPRDLVPADALAALAMPHAGLLAERSGGPCWQQFTPGDRLVSHVHHGRKYAETPLPVEKAFRFLHTNGATPPVAHTVAEFYALVGTVPLASLRHHLVAGDFSRWALEVLGDVQLAGGLRKLERLTRTGAASNRDEILDNVNDQYLV